MTMRLDSRRQVVCNLSDCGRIVSRPKAVPVSIVFDGHRIRGLACSVEHAAELRRGWTTRDAYGAGFGPDPVTILPSVKTG